MEKVARKRRKPVGKLGVGLASVNGKENPSYDGKRRYADELGCLSTVGIHHSTRQADHDQILFLYVLSNS